MSSNDVTGARLVSRVNDKNYEDGYDRIFRKKEQDVSINPCLDMPEPRGRCIIYDNDKEEIEND